MALHSQRPSDETTNVQIDPENTQNEVQVYVYVEITEDNTESWNMDVDLSCKTTEANNIVHRGRCILPREPSGSWADIQRPMANMGCDLENAISWFLYHILMIINLEHIKETSCDEWLLSSNGSVSI